MVWKTWFPTISGFGAKRWRGSDYIYVTFLNFTYFQNISKEML